MQPLQSVVPSFVRQLLRQGDMSPAKLEFAWHAAVGPVIGRVTTVRLAENGVLEVRADDAAWHRELRRSQAMLLGRLQELLGTDVVTKVKIVGRPGIRS